jgi:DNA-binding GntR family transcriptional regulator
VELEIVRTLAETCDSGLADERAAIVAGQEAMLAAGDLREFTSGDQLFHKRMYEAAHLADLWGLVRKQSGHLDRLRRLRRRNSARASTFSARWRTSTPSVLASRPTCAPMI